MASRTHRRVEKDVEVFDLLMKIEGFFCFGYYLDSIKPNLGFERIKS